MNDVARYDSNSSGWGAGASHNREGIYVCLADNQAGQWERQGRVSRVSEQELLDT